MKYIRTFESYDIKDKMSKILRNIGKTVQHYDDAKQCSIGMGDWSVNLEIENKDNIGDSWQEGEVVENKFREYCKQFDWYDELEKDEWIIVIECSVYDDIHLTVRLDN